MTLHPLAGQPVPSDMLIDVARLEREYYERKPDPSDPRQLIRFGTSGHRGTSFDGTLTEGHILAITQAISDYRRSQGIDGPLYMGKDTHALSAVAQRTALEVLAANGVETIIQQREDGVTPTPVVSHAILVHNRGRREHLADGIVVTPSHNPPEDGGFKYNPPNGGPADTDVTGWVEERANQLLRAGNTGVKRVPLATAVKAATTHEEDFVLPYVRDLGSVIDMESIRAAGLKLGVDPLGGAAVRYWEPIATLYRLNITVVNPRIDPRFGFMTLDHDGKIRMDCSSPYAMAGLVKLRHRYQVAFGNDPDADRHGIVTPSAGLMNPNDFLAVAIHYLLASRPAWPARAAVGKTLVSSSMIDRVVHHAGRRLVEMPVGFKWFAPGLFDGSICFGGEESAGHGPAGGGDHRAHRQGPGRPLPGADGRARDTVLRTDRCAGHARAESRAAEALARGRQGDPAGRRADRGHADPRPGERRTDRRLEGGDGQRLVCGPAVRDRRRLQDLRGKLQKSVSPRRHRRRSPAYRGRRAGRPRMMRPPTLAHVKSIVRAWR